MRGLKYFTEILQYPAYVNLQRFYKALLKPVYRDFMMHCLSSICRDFKGYKSIDNLCKCEIYKYVFPDIWFKPVFFLVFPIISEAEIKSIKGAVSR